MEATLKDIRDEWFEYIKEVETAARECEELKVRNKSLEVEIAKLKEELINRSIETAKLNASLTASADKIAKFYSQRVKSVQDSVKEISAQNQLVQQKYEVCFTESPYSEINYVPYSQKFSHLASKL